MTGNCLAFPFSKKKDFPPPQIYAAQDMIPKSTEWKISFITQYHLSIYWKNHHQVPSFLTPAYKIHRLMALPKLLKELHDSKDGPQIITKFHGINILAITKTIVIQIHK